MRFQPWLASTATALILIAGFAGVAFAQTEQTTSPSGQPFDWYGLAAVIGALAWIPILARWIYQWVAKPTMDVVISNVGELGYTTNGIIFNVQVAARVRKKPALITSIQLSLVHSNGRRINLVWNGLNEVLSQAESSTGDLASYTRTVPAIAVQVLPNTEIAQRKVMFDNVELRASANDLSGELVRRLMRIPDADEAQIVATDEYANLQEHYQNGFPWEAGTYAGEMSVTVHELKNPVVRKFRFAITDANVAHVRANLPLIEGYVRDLAANNNLVQPKFSWLNPVVTPEAH